MTYATHGIVYVMSLLPGVNLSHTQSMGYIFHVSGPQNYPKDVPNVREAAVSRSFPHTHRHTGRGRSAVNGGNTILVVANLVDGVDWYSLSEYTFISATKPLYAQRLSCSSTPVFLEGDNVVVVGGTNGKAHIFGVENFLDSLDHKGMYLPLYFLFARLLR